MMLRWRYWIHGMQNTKMNFNYLNYLKKGLNLNSLQTQKEPKQKKYNQQKNV